MTEIFLPWVGILVCLNPPAQWAPSYFLSSLPLVPAPFVRLFPPGSLSLSCARCHFLCFRKGPQRAEIFFPKAPGHVVGQKSRFPDNPRRRFVFPTGKPQKSQTLASKSWLPKAPGQELTQNGCFPRVPEGEFNSRPEGCRMPHICYQNAPGRIWPKTAVSQGSHKGSFVAGWGAAKFHKFVPRGSWPEFGPQRPLPNGPRRHV